MKIYSMTATFGKLNHASLTLNPGLNIIEAPNEWGKSTWCAFMIAMIYGIDTRQQTTKAALADKERYAPWHGEPMSGRMEICWNGRDITIERSSKGRIPFGTFRAYETDTGLDVQELTATNCGQLLLGVERNVFTRSGFIRLQDMPVTQDDALRRRLNNLVTTGDESGAGDKLGQQLKELKNKCRYNRSGLLPQAEYEREQLRTQLQQQQELQLQIGKIKVQRSELEQQLKLLENHADALRYEAALQGTQKLAQAQTQCRELELLVAEQAQKCSDLPTEALAESSLAQGRQLQAQQLQLSAQQGAMPQKPEAPSVPERFAQQEPAQALAGAATDYGIYLDLQAKLKKTAHLPLLLSIVTVLVQAIMALFYFGLKLLQPGIYIAVGAVALILGVSMMILCAVRCKKTLLQLAQLLDRHGDILPENWLADAQQYASAQQMYQQALVHYEEVTGQFSAQHRDIAEQLQQYTQGAELDAVLTQWNWVLEQHRLLREHRQLLDNAQNHLSALEAVAVTAPPPQFDDQLTLSQAQTEAQLDNIHFELRQSELKLGQCLGQAESIGEEALLKARLDSVSRRIHRLEEHYKALELAQEVLYQATNALQRRFAPRISKRAQEHFCRLTGGRYQRIALSDDLSVSASAENEDTLRAAQWRSDGTVDQLYLALRLAVAGELTPEAPLVLDDALIRFDDTRLQEALSLLQDEAKQKQVILFTCQSREKQLLPPANS